MLPDYFNFVFLRLTLVIAQISESGAGQTVVESTAEPQTGGAGVDATTVTDLGNENLLFRLLSDPLLFILVSGLLFMFLVLRPQQKQHKQLQQAMANLKKNDQVVLGSGIHGTVMQIDVENSTVVLKVDDKTGARLTVNRDSIARVV